MSLVTALLQARAAARDARDPCANLCTLSTVDANGEPQARTLVLRELEDRLAIFINATSPKWAQIETARSVSVLVYLPSQDAQFRIQATLVEVPKHLVDASWLMRPDTPKRLDVFYEQQHPQSAPLGPDEDLAAALSKHQPEVPQHAPASARGLYLEPLRIERLLLNNTGAPHEREIEYLDGTQPSRTRLMP